MIKVGISIQLEKGKKKKEMFEKMEERGGGGQNPKGEVTETVKKFISCGTSYFVSVTSEGNNCGPYE